MRPVSERRRLHGLPAQRADIFPAGLLILDEVVTAAGAETLIVSESDLLLGYAARRTKTAS
jgi:exopolyphosphatase/pppGpp-phosphohydrolase